MTDVEEVLLVKPKADVNGAELHPDRYCGKYECWDIIADRLNNKEWMSPFQGFLYGTIMRYLWRLGDKDSPEKELKKARNYLNKLIEDMELNNGRK